MNLDNGPVLGATLTVTSHNGTFLIALLALFVTRVGNQLWSILSFSIHQYRSTPDARDPFHHQQQVLLRTGLGDLGFLWRLLKTIWSWKSADKKAILRSLPLIASATIHMIALLAPSLATSRLATPNGEVLLNPTVCGWPNLTLLDIVQPNFGNDDGAQDAFYIGGNYIYKQSKDYASSCYALDVPDPSLCNSFVKASLPYRQKLNDTCPFSDNICRSTTVTFDTGTMDSHDHIGINTQVSDRVQFRKWLSCSNLPTDGDFSTDWTMNTTQPFWPWEPEVASGIAFKYYNYGEQDALGRTAPYTFWTTNYTNALEPGYSLA